MSGPETAAAVDTTAKPVTTHQIQTQAAIDAEVQFLDVARKHTSTMENKMDALIALQSTAAKRPVIEDRPTFDDVDVQMCRNIQEPYDADLSQSTMGQAIMRVANRLYVEHTLIDNGIDAKRHRVYVPMNKSRLWPLYEKTLKRADIWNTATTLEGQEWAPIGVSTQRIDLARIEARVPALFPQIPIRQMRALYVPTISGAAAVRWATTSPQFVGTTAPSYSGTQTPNNPAINQALITPGMQMTDPAFINRMLIEDSPTAVIEALTSEIGKALAHGWESSLLNGQTTALAANLDGANGPLAARDAPYSGLRYFAIVTNTGAQSNSAGAAFTYADWNSILAKMGIFALKNASGNVGSTVAIFAPKLIFDLTASPVPGAVSIGPLGSYSVFGPGNPIPVGTVTMLNGIPIVPTQNWPAMLATGKVDAVPGNNLFTCGCIVDTSRWREGVAREMEIRTVPFDLDDAIGARGFARHGFADAPPTTDRHVGFARNVAA